MCRIYDRHTPTTILCCCNRYIPFDFPIFMEKKKSIQYHTFPQISPPPSPPHPVPSRPLQAIVLCDPVSQPLHPTSTVSLLPAPKSAYAIIASP